MKIIDKLLNCNSLEDLYSFIEDYSQEFHDYFGQPYEQIKNDKFSINDYILQNQQLTNMNLSKGSNLAFLSLLLAYTEKYGLTASFQKLFNVLKDKSTIGSRLEAASLYLLNIHTYDEYLDVYNEIVDKLQTAALFEEDKIETVVSTFANYVNKVLVDAGSKVTYIEQLKENIYDSRKNDGLHFVNHPIIDKILELDCSDYKKASITIQSLIDSLFFSKNKSEKHSDYVLLIEKDTRYTNLVEKVSSNFDAVRNISNSLCSHLTARNSIYSDLGKGVSILEYDDQMLVYMQAYGNMHRAKLLSALHFLPASILSKQIEIIDWGCGQAIASMVFCEYLLDKDILINVDKIILVEPSEICIKRGAFHSKKFYGELTIKTVNKKFNLLNEDDIKTHKSTVKVHLFSNILDADVFSISQLSKLLSVTQHGNNCFVCVSPYITDSTNGRIDSFCNYFRKNYSSFQMLGEETFGKRDEYWNCNYHYKGDAIHHNHCVCGGKNKWTKIVRVFQVSLP
jgi:hypothetical protein